MRTLATVAMLAASALALAGSVRAAGTTKTELKPFNLTIRVFDPGKGIEGGQDYVLPVDMPNACLRLPPLLMISRLLAIPRIVAIKEFVGEVS